MSGADPPLSVLLPVRNGAPFLSRSLDSLRSQTFGDFEIVAVDDGSEDGTGEILDDWSRKDRRMRVFPRRHAGIVASLEYARARARGAYLARMDADDEALPDRFKRQMELMVSDPRVTLCGGEILYFPREQLGEGSLRYESWINSLHTPEELARDLFVECTVPHPTFLVRAKAMDLVGGYRDRRWPEDYDLLLRIWEGGGRLAKIPQVLLRWRESPDRLSRVHPAYSQDAFRRCRVHYLLRTLCRGRRVMVWGAGPVGKAFARELRAQGGDLAFFVDLHPNRIGEVIHGVPVLHPREAVEVSEVFSVAAVAKAGGRDEIRQALADAGRVEMVDFVAVA